MNSALLIIDMQKGFLDNRRCYPSINSTLEYINTAVELFNEIRKPILDEIKKFVEIETVKSVRLSKSKRED
ncbi:unnamed protein product [marine sediment metagenome]|uniref:Isochorismatase-like domain-containing protein n=1 Tax=marine sediment metagenome TaxID=412755 RepID=X1TH75_9ZZZZ